MKKSYFFKSIDEQNAYRTIPLMEKMVVVQFR